MTFEYLPVEQAIPHPGLRMAVVPGVPSPWGEAAKGIFHIKNIEWHAVRLVYDSEPLKKWAGHRNGAVAIYAEEHPPQRLGRHPAARRAPRPLSFLSPRGPDQARADLRLRPRDLHVV